MPHSWARTGAGAASSHGHGVCVVLAGRAKATDSVKHVIRRHLEFAPDVEMPTGLIEAASTPGVVSLIPPGPEREAVMARLKEDLEHRASRLGKLATELHQLVARHDPAQLIPSIAVPASMGALDPDATDDAPHTFSTDAKIEYLAGLALAGPPGTEQVDETTTRRAVALISAVFDAVQASLILQPPSDQAAEHMGHESASFFLRLQYVYDRTAGYAVHLEEIGDEVFEPHRALYSEELGFCPCDAIRLVRRYIQWSNVEFNDAREAMWEATSTEPVDTAAAAESTQRFLGALDATYLWTPDLLARCTQIPVDQVAAMLHGMSVEFGCQPEFRTPLDDNQGRRHPLIRLPDETYLAPVPWSVAHGVHDWLQGWIKDNPTSRLVTKYPQHRSDAAERLVRRCFQEVFGEGAVHHNQHYVSSDGHGEIDCLVAGSTPIVVEVKSRALTDQGQRGRHRRLRSVAKDVVTKSFEQTLRARNYIVGEAGRCFADRQAGQPRQLLSDEVNDLVEIVVTLERMDPLAAYAGELADSDQPRSTWVTNLADLLMVRDILEDAASFLHYARLRGRASKLGIRVISESDALETYLDDRLSSVIGLAEESQDQPGEVLLGYSSTEINQYFTMSEVDIDQSKPSTGVPQVISEALRTCAGDYPAAWTTIATAVMSAPPDIWRRWQRFQRRHQSEHPFLLPCGTASIVTSSSLTSAEIHDAPIPLLRLPRTSRRRHR